MISPTTELDAVNEIIGAIGEAPVNTLENLMNVDVINALRILRNNNRAFQSRGWSFNSVTEYPLNPDVYSKKIKWLDVYLKIDGEEGTKYVKQGDYVYDLIAKTSIFESPISVNAIILVPFEDMPEPARNYIVAKASAEFQSRYLGDESLTQILNNKVQETWQYLQEDELDKNEYNLLDHTHVQELLTR